MTPIKTRAAQVAVISCEPDSSVVEGLKIELEAQLTNRATTILTYGVSLKRQEGFIVVEIVTSFDEIIMKWLKDHPCVKDYIIYETPSKEMEDRATEEAQSRVAVLPRYEPEQQPICPPVLPEGYTPYSDPRPMLSTQDSYWIAWAWSEQEGMGLVVYDQQSQYRGFFSLQECTTLLSTLIERAGFLLSQCTSEYLARHAPGINLIQAHLGYPPQAAFIQYREGQA